MPKQFYPLKEGYSSVIKKDIYNGTIVYLREDIFKGIIKPYTQNVVGKVRIGIKEPNKGENELSKWTYCSHLCKKK